MDYGEPDFSAAYGGFLDSAGFDPAQIDLRQSFGGGDLSPSLSSSTLMSLPHSALTNTALTQATPAASSLATTTTTTTAPSSAASTVPAAVATSISSSSPSAITNSSATSAPAPGSHFNGNGSVPGNSGPSLFELQQYRLQQQQHHHQQQQQQYLLQQQRFQQHQQQQHLHLQQQQQPHYQPPHQGYQQQPQHPSYQQHQQHQYQSPQYQQTGGISIPSHHHQLGPAYQGPGIAQYQLQLQQQQQQMQYSDSGIPYRTTGPAGMPGGQMDDHSMYDMDAIDDSIEQYAQFIPDPSGGMANYYPEYPPVGGEGPGVGGVADLSPFYPTYQLPQGHMLPAEPTPAQKKADRKKKSQRPEGPEDDEEGSPDEVQAGKEKPPRKKSAQSKAMSAAAAAAVAAASSKGGPKAQQPKPHAREEDAGFPDPNELGMMSPGQQELLHQQQQAHYQYQQQQQLQLSLQVRQAQKQQLQNYQANLKYHQVRSSIANLEAELRHTMGDTTQAKEYKNRLLRQLSVLVEQKNQLQQYLENPAAMANPGMGEPLPQHAYANQAGGSHDPNLYAPIIHTGGPNNPNLSSISPSSISNQGGPSAQQQQQQVTSPPPQGHRKDSPSGGYRSPVSTPSTPSTPKPMSSMMSSFSVQNYQPEKHTPVMPQDAVTAASPSQLVSTWVPFSNMNITQPMDTMIEAFPNAPPQFQTSTAQRAAIAQQQQQQQQQQQPGETGHSFQLPLSVRKISGKPQLIRSVSFTNSLPSQGDQQPEDEGQKISSPNSTGGGSANGSRSNNSSPSSTRPVVMKSKRSNSTPSVITNLAGLSPGSPILSPVGGPKLKAKGAASKGGRRAKAPVGTNLEGQIRIEIQTKQSGGQVPGDDSMDAKDSEAFPPSYQHYPIEESATTRLRLSGDKAKWQSQGLGRRPSEEEDIEGSNSDDEDKPSSRRASRTHEPEEEEEEEEEEDVDEDGEEDVDLEDNSEENSGDEIPPAAKGAIKARSKSSDGVLAAGSDEGSGKKMTRRKSSDSSSQKTFPCDVEGCTKVFKRSEHLKRHTRTHTGERPFVCNHPGCIRAFSRTDNLAQHQKTHVAGTEKKKRIKKSSSGNVRQPEDEE